MSEFFIVRLTPNQSKMQSNMEEKALLGKGHSEYIDKLVENKFIKFGGPIDGKPGGMLIVSADNKEKVESVFNEDPMIKNNYIFVEINKWNINHGTLE